MLTAKVNTDELEQLRRIDRAARAFVDANPSLKYQHCRPQYEALLKALYDGRPQSSAPEKHA